MRAYDARTGKLRWTFHTVPQPGEFGYDTWPKDAWTYSGNVASWQGMSLDEQRGIVYVATANPVNMFIGRDRLGDNLFGNSLLALDANTGKRIWHFQTVKHDIWDRDLPSPPSLITVRRDGKNVDAVAITTKTGHVFVFDRTNGTPLFPIEYKKYPASTIAGEVASETQPLPTKPEPFARQLLTADMVTTTNTAGACGGDGAVQEDDQQRAVRPAERRVRTPSASLAWMAERNGAGRRSIRTPVCCTSIRTRWCGCTRWPRIRNPARPSAAKTCTTASARRATAMTGRARRRRFHRSWTSPRRCLWPKCGRLCSTAAAACRGSPRWRPTTPTRSCRTSEMASNQACPSLPTAKPVPWDTQYRFTGHHKFLDIDGYPAITPPWGTLNAINMNTGEYAWKIPLGEYPELVAKGLKDTGSENYGGPIVTAGGLVFIAATNYDKKFRAFDKSTGKLVWETTLPFTGNATPATYEINGRQYIVIATSGAGRAPAQRNTRPPQPGARYIAFALPSQREVDRSTKTRRPRTTIEGAMMVLQFRKFAATTVSAIAFFCLSSALVFAQTTGTVTGTVKDDQGGVIPGATVTLISEARGTSLEAVTTATGDFVFSNITGDTYTVRVSMDGFKTAERRGIAVSPGDRVVVGTLNLEVGTLAETVLVSGEAPMIQSQTGERSFTVAQTQVENLPNTGRNFASFAALVPGVVGTTVSAGGNAAISRLGGGTTNFLLDGVSNVDPGGNGQGLQLNMDAIAEVKVLSSAYQAEYGRSSGLQISGVTKSGTNQFHGSFFDIERNWKVECQLLVERAERHCEACVERAGLRIYGRRPHWEGGRAEQPVLLLRPPVRAAHDGRRCQPVPLAHPARASRGFLPVDRQHRRALPLHQRREHGSALLGCRYTGLLPGWRCPRANSSEPPVSARAQRSEDVSRAEYDRPELQPPDRRAGRQAHDPAADGAGRLPGIWKAADIGTACMPRLPPRSRCQARFRGSTTTSRS